MFIVLMIALVIITVVLIISVLVCCQWKWNWFSISNALYYLRKKKIKNKVSKALTGLFNAVKALAEEECAEQHIESLKTILIQLDHFGTCSTDEDKIVFAFFPISAKDILKLTYKVHDAPFPACKAMRFNFDELECKDSQEDNVKIINRCKKDINTLFTQFKELPTNRI